MPNSIYAIFHLNLAFSSIDDECHSAVIEKCYWPLLKLIKEHHIPLGLELTGYTLERINTIAPHWLIELKTLLEKDQCELVASGQSQLIGPLVPGEVNKQNQALGLKAYQSLLNYTPKIAYINEQAFSSSLLDIYIDAGFEAICMEWDNAYSLHPEWPSTLCNKPSLIQANSGRMLPVIWNRSILFQKLQRVCHGEITKQEYLEFIDSQNLNSSSCLSIYGNDAEVFNYRPGRFKEEKKIEIDEWKTLIDIFIQLRTNANWIPIRDILKYLDKSDPIVLTTPESPIIVKKQNKYNINRWALSGVDDLYINTLCYKVFNNATKLPFSADLWKQLCESWGSDFRTHIGENRFRKNLLRLESLQKSLPDTTFVTKQSYSQWQVDQSGRFLHIKSKDLHIVLNTSKGCSIHSLLFTGHSSPLIGTIEHGVFSHISLAADFFSNFLIAELPSKKQRVTDLGINKFTILPFNDDGNLKIEISLSTPFGEVIKGYEFIESDRVYCYYKFLGGTRPDGTLRIGALTLLNINAEHQPIYSNYFGGTQPETHKIQKNISHGSSVSSIISSSNNAGSSSGNMQWGIKGEFAQITWDPSECAAIPMLHNQIEHNERFSRLFFSLVELDETLKKNGSLPNVRFCLSKGELND
ncbi:hypothetical protein [Neptuniibacter sp.]|uniref:hypothetical protein n=1 Tax=Neptuniibacter sp. TaxID=1962643 RepID=UPI00260F6661|nr:hypothetical protein [Neptuniibacter sp.]MCP4595913.1 glycoside hydrolase [Neptuniibacter sp.]